MCQSTKAASFASDGNSSVCSDLSALELLPAAFCLTAISPCSRSRISRSESDSSADDVAVRLVLDDMLYVRHVNVESDIRSDGIRLSKGGSELRFDLIFTYDYPAGIKMQVEVEGEPPCPGTRMWTPIVPSLGRATPGMMSLLGGEP